MLSIRTRRHAWYKVGNSVPTTNHTRSYVIDVLCCWSNYYNISWWWWWWWWM